MMHGVAELKSVLGAVKPSILPLSTILPKTGYLFSGE